MGERPTAPPGRLRLRPPRNRVDKRSIAHWTLRAVAVTVCVVAPPAVTAVLLGQLANVPMLTVAFWIATATVGIPAMAVTVVMPQWRYRVHRWETTDDAVYTLSGWFWQEWRVAPMSRIQTVDTRRGPLQRPLGLSTVIVTTASAAGALQIESLDAERAAQVTEQLTAATQGTPGDAT